MRLPFTLRLIYHSFRATVRAGLLFALAWLFLIPASATELRALGAAEDTQFPVGLRMMRTAKIVVTIAPDRAYTAIAMFAGPEVSPLLVRIAMVQMASGNVLPASMTRGDTTQSQSDRDIEGPRFIQVD